ncbi:MAG TPA: ATP-binding cassette domain-containing protein [Cytophagaceae bacterium]|jgi:putative ABC transport system ATP-binding protein|nr:ATP-binding cassette domain-containing protein [Cytophagaceae bacterium]
MIIRFNKVTPYPLDGVTHLNTEIWGKELFFDTNKKYKIDAPSGKGKSTFIHLLYGLRNDYKGDIFIDDKNIKQLINDDWAAIRQSEISIIFQDLRLFPELTAIENINLKYDLKNHISKEKITEYFELLKISHIKDKAAKYLSYGERQRVAIIRALVQPFHLLLMDEPFSHLDEGNATIAADVIKKECEERNAGYIITSLGGESYFRIDETVTI